MFELRPLERQLRTRAKHQHAAESTVTISMPVYDHFAGDLVLFEPTSLHSLLELRSFVRELELAANLFTNRPQVIGADAHQWVRAKAAMAANRVPAAKAALEAAGGVSPVDWEVDYVPPGTSLELGPPAFPNAAMIQR